jgi:hypothetical protein
LATVSICFRLLGETRFVIDSSGFFFFIVVGGAWLQL